MSKQKLKAGTTSFIADIFVEDSSVTTGAGLSGLVYNTASLTAKYKRRGDNAWTTISLVTATAGTFTSGGFIAAGSAPTGAYELHVPNAALAAGATGVVIIVAGAANMVPVKLEIELDAVDYQDAAGFGLSRVDAAVSSRSSHSAAGAATAVRSELTTELARIDAAVSSRSSHTAAGAATAVRSELTTELARIDAAVSSRLADASYTAPDNAGIASAASAASSAASSAYSAATAAGNAETAAASAASAAASAASSAASADGKATSILSKLLKYVQLMVRKDAAIATDNATELTAINANGGSGAGDFANTTDATQAIRDRGDAAWTTGGGGGGGTTILNIVPSTVGVGDVSSDPITAYRLAAGNATIAVVDSEGTEVELPETLTFCVEAKARGGRADVFTKTPTPDGNQAAIAWTADDVPTGGDFAYSLRDSETGRVYAEGVFRVKYAALADTE